MQKNVQNPQPVAQSAVVAGAPATTSPHPPPRRAPGTKEVIPLAWKLVGMSEGTPVTLLKCIERVDAEAQMQRLESEHFYSELEIYPIDEVVPLSPKLLKKRKQLIEAAFKAAAARQGSRAGNRFKRKAPTTKTPARSEKASPERGAKAPKTTAKKSTKTVQPAKAKSAVKQKGGKKTSAKKAAPKKATVKKTTVKQSGARKATAAKSSKSTAKKKSRKPTAKSKGKATGGKRTSSSRKTPKKSKRR